MKLAVAIFGASLIAFSLCSQRNETERPLQRYGFLSPSLREYGRAPTDEEYSQAIKDVQYMAGLPETGELDNSTLRRVIGKRCGVRDNIDALRNSRPSEEGRLRKLAIKWATIRYSSRIGLLAIRDVFLRAFEYWADASRFEFKEVVGHMADVVAEADILISFSLDGFHGDGFMFDSEGSDLAHTYYDDERNKAIIHFADEEAWTDNSTPSNGEVDLYKVAIHQIGHALGLSHSTNAESVMFPWYEESSSSDITEDEHIKLIEIEIEIDAYSEKDELTTAIGSSPNLLTTTSAQMSMDCPDSVDAVLVMRNVTFFFKDTVFWALNTNGQLVDKRTSIHDFWIGLPENLTKIDAVYRQKKGTPSVHFFIGDKYYTFVSNTLPRESEARPITDFCLPSEIKKVDAVFTWDRNEMTYIISGNMYWKIDEESMFESCSETSLAYPQDMSVWGAARIPVYAAATAFDDNLYFFHKEYYWKFNDREMRVEEESQRTINSWVLCEPPPPASPTVTEPQQTFYNNSAHSSQLHKISFAYYLSVVVFRNLL